MPTGSGGSTVGWPLAAFATGDTFNAFNAGVNTVAHHGFALPYALTFSTITVNISANDAAHNYDIGLYANTGVLVADIGAQTLPSTGVQTFTTVQGIKTIPPGLYTLAFTGNNGTASLSYDAAWASWIGSGGVGVSAGGQLPNSIGALTPTPSAGIAFFVLT